MDERDEIESDGAEFRADIAALKLVVTLLMGKLEATQAGLKLTNAVKRDAMQAIADMPFSSDEAGKLARSLMERSVIAIVSRVAPI